MASASSASRASTQPLIIVSGLPRSGTSMMMKMLEAGGVAVVTDGERTADEDNPGGYYEFEPVKKTKEDPSWLAGTAGKAVKMVYRLVYDLPADRTYKVLFMRRRMDEVLASQKVMLERSGGQAGGDDAAVAALFLAEIDKFYAWQASQTHVEVLNVDYNRLQEHAEEVLKEVAAFLEAPLDQEAMAGVVNPSLYRNRRSPK